MKKNILLLLLILTAFFVFSDSDSETEGGINAPLLVLPEINMDIDTPPDADVGKDFIESETIINSWDSISEELIAGKPKKSVISLKDDFYFQSKIYKLKVAEDTFALELKITNAQADLDLFVYKADKENQVSDADFISETDKYNESLFITRLSDLPLETGEYYVEVAYQYDYLPHLNGQLSKEIKFTLTAREVSSRPTVELKNGKPAKLTLSPENGMFVSAAVRIPRGTKAFRVDVYDTNSDVDILSAVDSPAMTRADALYAAETMLGAESLIIESTSQKPLDDGNYYLSFTDQLTSSYEQDFSVVVSLSSEAPDIVKQIPHIPVYQDSFDAALLSTVEVITDTSSGSGCLVSSDGHLITNLHVITDSQGKPAESIYVALSLSKDEPPKEKFSASVVDYDEKLDLALLIVDKGRYDQKLPSGFEFPFLRLGDSKEITIGQPIGVLGYPDLGGTGSRSTITFTKGVVSGFERTPYVTYIKTNALISGGNSGGAVINTYYELLGITCYTIDVDNARMGYVFPVSNLPKKWINKIKD